MGRSHWSKLCISYSLNWGLVVANPPRLKFGRFRVSGETDRLQSARNASYVPRVFSAEGCHFVEEGTSASTANDASNFSRK